MLLGEQPLLGSGSGISSHQQPLLKADSLQVPLGHSAIQGRTSLSTPAAAQHRR